MEAREGHDGLRLRCWDFGDFGTFSQGETHREFMVKHMENIWRNIAKTYGKRMEFMVNHGASMTFWRFQIPKWDFFSIGGDFFLKHQQ